MEFHSGSAVRETLAASGDGSGQRAGFRPGLSSGGGLRVSSTTTVHWHRGPPCDPITHQANFWPRKLACFT